MSAEEGQISAATIGRLPIYLRALAELAADGVTTVNSEALATATGVQSALVRRDLSQFGSYGIRGVGYVVESLQSEIQDIVGGRRTWRVLLVGAGNLGQALARHTGLAALGFEIVAIIDSVTRSLHLDQASTTLLYFSPWVIRPSWYCCS